LHTFKGEAKFFFSDNMEHGVRSMHKLANMMTVRLSENMEHKFKVHTSCWS